jgi:hypothetical protein
VQISRGQSPSLRLHQELVADNQLEKHKAQDALRHVRLQNDAMRIQVEGLNKKAGPNFPSFRSQPKSKSPTQGWVQGQNQDQSRGRGQGNGQSLVSMPAKSILQLSRDTPEGTVKQILHFIKHNLADILDLLPKFIGKLWEIYTKFTSSPSTTSISTQGRNDKVKNERKLMVSRKIKYKSSWLKKGPTSKLYDKRQVKSR